MANETPMMWTSKGNVPVSSLRYEHRWSEDEQYIRLEEFWYDGEEIVKNNLHMLAKHGLSMGGKQAVMG